MNNNIVIPIYPHNCPFKVLADAKICMPIPIWIMNRYTFLEEIVKCVKKIENIANIYIRITERRTNHFGWFCMQ